MFGTGVLKGTVPATGIVLDFFFSLLYQNIRGYAIYEENEFILITDL